MSLAPIAGHARQVLLNITKPSGISIDPQGNIWTTSWLRETLTISSPTGQQLRTMSTARSPTQVRFGGDLAFFTSELGGKIFAVEARTLAPVYTLRDKAILPGVYVNDGIGYYVASYKRESGLINAFDPATGRSLGSVSTGVLLPRGLAFNKAGTIMVTASKAQNELVEISVRRMSVIATFPVGVLPRATVISHHAAFSANTGDGTVTRIDLGTGLSETIVVGAPDSGPRRMVAHGQRLYVGLQNSDDVKVIDLETNAIVRTLNLDGSPRQLAFDAKSHRLYVAELGGDKVVSFRTRRKAAPGQRRPASASGGAPIADISMMLPLYIRAF